MATTIADSGFYGIVNFATSSKEIVEVGYAPGITKYTPPYLVVVQPPDNLIYKYETQIQVTLGGTIEVQVKVEPEEQIRTPFEAFLQTLYGYSASLTSESVYHDLNQDMIDNGLTGQYARVQVVDFMAFTGAIDRYQTLPDGTLVDCLSIEAGEPRPNLNGLKFKDDFSLMNEVIRHIGIQGMYPYLYAREGIDFKEFCDQLRIWKPEKEERETYIYDTLIPLLRVEKSPVLTEAQVLSLVKE